MTKIQAKIEGWGCGRVSDEEVKRENGRKRFVALSRCTYSG
jgi:hypothetical protein